MHFGALKRFDVANGEGVRTTLFVSGCRNACKGCFQPETWSFDYGELFTEDVEKEIFECMENPSVRGLTLLGGEPMEPENQRELLPFLLRFKHKYPHKTVWLYTGNTYEELLGLSGEHYKHLDITAELLSLVDVLVDGRYEEEKKNIGLRFRGSENQRIIDMKLTREKGEIVIWHGVSEDKHFSPVNKK